MVHTWASPCDANVTARGGEGSYNVRPCYKLPLYPTSSLFCYISLLHSLNMKYLFCWQLILLFVYLTSALKFFFCSPANVVTTSYHIKTFCSCWVLRPSNNACLLNLVSTASFLTQSDWLEKKADQSLCFRKEALGTRLIPTNTMVGKN